MCYGEKTTATAVKTTRRGSNVFKTRYTPAELIAALAIAFLVQDGKPAIDMKSGEPTYPMANGMTTGSGCFAYTLYRMQPDVLAKLNKIATHKAARAMDLPTQGIQVEDLVDGTGYYGLSTSYDRIAFVQEVQDVHDTAAKNYWVARTQNKVRAAKAARTFQAEALAGLRDVAIKWDIKISDVNAEIKKMGGGLKTWSIRRKFAAVPA